MRLQPGITVIAPADYEQAQTALLDTWDLPGPIYYRLGKNDQTTIPELEGHFELRRAELLGQGEDLLFIAMGSITSEVAAAITALAAQGVACKMMVVASLNPAPIEDLAKVLAHFRLAITVESHYLVGGLGSLVSEVVAERGLHCRLVRCGVRTTPKGISGSQSYLRQAHDLSSERLVEIALQTWHESKLETA